jgi:hypothetical protein
MTICKEDNCKTWASFNYKHEYRGIFCKKHKLFDMLNVTGQKCINENCQKIACFNYKTEKTKLYCNTHKLDNMLIISLYLKKNALVNRDVNIS